MTSLWCWPHPPRFSDDPANTPDHPDNQPSSNTNSCTGIFIVLPLFYLPDLHMHPVRTTACALYKCSNIRAISCMPEPGNKEKMLYHTCSIDDPLREKLQIVVRICKKER